MFTRKRNRNGLGIKRALFCAGIGFAIARGLAGAETFDIPYKPYDTLVYGGDTCTVGIAWEDASAVAVCTAEEDEQYYIAYDPEPGVWEPWQGCYDYRAGSDTWGEIMSTQPEVCWPQWFSN